MKRVLLLSALFGLHIVLKAQKVYFIYLQSETSTPFYVKMAGKIQSSTAEGYLIIPKLTDSTYLLTIGQPGKQTEPQFSITISRSDRGFLIKDFNGTPGLFDLQTMTIQRPVTSEATGSAVQTVAKNDNFTRLLARAADDTTLLSQPVVVQAPKAKPKDPKAEVVEPKQEVALKKDSAQQAVAAVSPPIENKGLSSTGLAKKDTMVNTPPVSPETLKETAVAIKEEAKPAITKQEITPVDDKTIETSTIEEDYKRSVVTKRSESSTSEGFGLVFIDTYKGVNDTIQLIIPNPKIVFADATQKQSSESPKFLEITSGKPDSVSKEVMEAGKDKEITGAGKEAPPEIKKEIGEVNATENSDQIKPKSQCQTVASDDDFFKLRRDMVARSNDDEMITQAKKYFKAKCYRTEQIKYLSNLFLSDEGKYQFFDAAFLHVSDQQRFASLQLELKDTYYINRFKALIGN